MSDTTPIELPCLPALNSHQVEIADLRFSLAKRVPSMERGFTIQTHYGPIVISSDFAEAFMELTADVLNYQLIIHHKDE